jgi:hypothetical protein
MRSTFAFHRLGRVILWKTTPFMAGSIDSPGLTRQVPGWPAPRLHRPIFAVQTGEEAHSDAINHGIALDF